jgi:hypothetical protein
MLPLTGVLTGGPINGLLVVLVPLRLIVIGNVVLLLIAIEPVVLVLLHVPIFCVLTINMQTPFVFTTLNDT